MEGYPESVKFLHNNPKWNHTSPILSDIIYVKEEYRAAVENVLEPYLNYYVVNDLEEGMQAIYLLDANQKGKANFFLLDRIDNFKKVEEHQPANTIKSLDVIEVEEKYRHLAEYLLYNVYIAEGEDALEDSNGSTVLEKHGKFVKGKFSLSGGSVGLFEGMEQASLTNMPELLKTAYLQIKGDKNGLQVMHDKDKARMLQFKDWSDEDLSLIKAPALIIAGDKDVVAPVHAVEMAQKIPNAELLILPGVHGFCIGEVCSAKQNSKIPELTVGLIKEFLNT